MRFLGNQAEDTSPQDTNVQATTQQTSSSRTPATGIAITNIVDIRVQFFPAVIDFMQGNIDRLGKSGLLVFCLVSYVQPATPLSYRILGLPGSQPTQLRLIQQTLKIPLGKTQQGSIRHHTNGGVALVISQQGILPKTGSLLQLK